MNSRFDTKAAKEFDAADNFWLLFMAVAALFWLSPFFDGQENSLLKTTALGAIAFLLGLFLRFSYQDVEIDAAKKNIREYISILGFKTGDWEPLADLFHLPLEKSGKT